MAENAGEEKKVVYQGEQKALPEAGDARRDELKKKHDALMEEAEKLAEELGLYGIAPGRLSPDGVDREVRQATGDQGEVYVSNADMNHRYGWVYGDPKGQYGNRFVNAFKVLGWEVVGGQQREAWEHRKPDGTRWVADCLLMRTRLDNYLRLQQLDRKKRKARHEGITAGLDELGDKYGVKIRHEVPEGIASQMESQVVQQRRQRKIASRG
jgi:hypothetical protein